MGYNTTVLILNDALDTIENDPEFGKKLVAAILQCGGRGGPINVPVGNHANPVSVIESHHADQMRVVAVGGNTSVVLGYGGGYRSEKDQILKHVAEDNDFVIYKKPKR